MGFETNLKFRYLILIYAMILLADLIYSSSLAWGAIRDDVIKGPIDAVVLEVVDGDTIKVEAAIWPGQSVKTGVRLRGYDAPELKARCAREKEMAVAAADLMEKAVASKKVTLYNVHFGKYAGRVVADIYTADDRSVGTLLEQAELAHLYDGGKRQSWC